MARPNSAQTISLIGGRGLNIPAEWNAETFAKHGARMIQTMARVAKFTQLRAAPDVARRAIKIFDSQLKRIISRTQQTRQHYRLGLRAVGDESIILSFPQEEEIWAEAINEVMRNADIEVVTEMMPPIQSTMAQGYSKTAQLLNQRIDAQSSAAITQQTRKIASKIVGINDTTKKNVLDAVKEGVEKQMTVKELAEHVEEKANNIFGNRALTIARTELSNAWTQGSVISFKESDAITEVSVIGCMAREASSPHFDGESTCNIQGVPFDRIDELMAIGWHINHTGTLVPSGFKSDSD